MVKLLTNRDNRSITFGLQKLMKTLITLGLLALTLSAFGQNSPFSVGLAGGRSFYSYGLDYVEGAVSQSTYVNNYDIGLHSSYSLNEKLSIGISVLYSEKDYRLILDFDQVRWVDPNDPLRATGKTTLNYELRYVDLLLALKRSIMIRGLTSLYGSVGIRPGIKLYENEPSIGFSPRRLVGQKLLISGNLGLGVKQGFSSRSGMFLEPTLAYYLNQAYENEGGRNTIAFRVLAGLYYRL